jgi:hypothetical protein
MFAASLFPFWMELTSWKKKNCWQVFLPLGTSKSTCIKWVVSLGVEMHYFVASM